MTLSAGLMSMADCCLYGQDLEDRGLIESWHSAFSTPIWNTRDYGGLALLDYYKAYRAMVRAKVRAAAPYQTVSVTRSGRRSSAAYKAYTRLAAAYTHVPLRFGC